MNTFQTHMNQYPAPGIPGAFASDNPHASYVAGEGALITGPDGLVIARFAWVTVVLRITDTNNDIFTVLL
ncbi:hypothetical protein E2790_13230 [Salmonella enterica]|nr:hypothetical protein [Salmonella enterica]